jgi:coenzyme F420-reducing hydrogenase gamma subunit
MPVPVTVGPITESIRVQVVTLGCPDNEEALQNSFQTVLAFDVLM